MSEINWKLAPEGAIGVAQRGQQLAFVDNDRNIFLDGHWGISMGWELVAKRSTKKTVADAVEYYGKTFVAGQWTHIRCGKDGKMFFASGETDSDNWQDSYLVCTRADFEAYVNASKIGKILESSDEKEGEKWTHTYDGQKVRWLGDKPDSCEEMAIQYQSGEYGLARVSALKPIKPTMTKEQHEFLCKFSADSNNLEVIAEVESYLAKHDIVEVPAND